MPSVLDCHHNNWEVILCIEEIPYKCYTSILSSFMQRQFKEIVAIKCIEKKRLTKHSMENLLTEISVMKDLSHRHIVKLIDFEVCGDIILLILQKKTPVYHTVESFFIFTVFYEEATKYKLDTEAKGSTRFKILMILI